MEWIFGAVALVLSTTLPVLISNRKTRGAVGRVHDEVRTNHGLRAGDYLEMVAQVQETSAAQGRVIASLAQSWGDHTVADAVSFEEISKRLEHIEDAVRHHHPPTGGRRAGDAQG